MNTTKTETPCVFNKDIETLTEFVERMESMKRDLFASVSDEQRRIKLQHSDMLLQRRLKKIKDPYTRANVVFHEMIAKSSELVALVQGKFK